MDRAASESTVSADWSPSISESAAEKKETVIREKEDLINILVETGE
jgi:hypothetical protein